MKKRSTIKVVVATLVVRRVLVNSQYMKGVAAGIKHQINKEIARFNERHPDADLPHIPDWPQRTYTAPRVMYPYNRPMRTYTPSIRNTLDATGIMLTSREEAELVLEKMNEIMDSYQRVSVQELYQLVGIPNRAMDDKFGWDNVEALTSARIKQSENGYLLKFPAPKPLS